MQLCVLINENCVSEYEAARHADAPSDQVYGYLSAFIALLIFYYNYYYLLLKDV